VLYCNLLVSKQYVVEIFVSTLIFVPHCGHVTTPHNLMRRLQRWLEANCFNLLWRRGWYSPQKLITLYGVITQRIITRIYSAIKVLHTIHEPPWNMYPELCVVCWSVGHAVAQCLRHCATNRKVAGSIPDYVIGIFHWHNPSGRTMALGSTQPLTEMSTRNISWR
jgi:hypothetical protein